MATQSLDFDMRRSLAINRTHELITRSELRARDAWRSFYALQVLTVGLAAITPCLIFLAKANPQNTALEWLQLFFPALAAVSAGASHIFRWREDGVRNRQLAESLRSELWHYETRSVDCPPRLNDDEALDHLVTRVDALVLQEVSQWGAEQLATGRSKPQPA
jgi:uncharacterized protein DUF4231